VKSRIAKVVKKVTIAILKATREELTYVAQFWLGTFHKRLVTSGFNKLQN
jgi:hypothetical protein